MNDALVHEYRLLMADVYELAGRSRATSEAFARRRGQTAARWHVLSVVLAEPHTVPQIADRLGVTRQSVQRVVNDLVTEELVELTPNPRHQRSNLVSVSSPGRQIADALFRDSAATRLDHINQAELSSRDLEAARQVLQQLLESLGSIGER